MESGALAQFMPTAMLDAGDADWPQLSERVLQRMETLPANGILEISFGDPDLRSPLLEWCRSVGHDLFQMAAEGDRTWLWIKKR